MLEHRGRNWPTCLFPPCYRLCGCWLCLLFLGEETKQTDQQTEYSLIYPRIICFFVLFFLQQTSDDNPDTNSKEETTTAVKDSLLKNLIRLMSAAVADLQSNLRRTITTVKRFKPAMVSLYSPDFLLFNTSLDHQFFRLQNVLKAFLQVLF